MLNSIRPGSAAWLSPLDDPAAEAAGTPAAPRAASDHARGHDPSDADLVRLAREDRAAFAPLYDRYADPVYRFCFRRLGTREAAEDATAQTFVRALAALPAYREHNTFAAWLFTIAANAVADAHRRRRPHAPLEAAGDPPDRDPTPEEAALAAEERGSVRALLAALPPDQRRALELRLAGLSGAEVAQAMGRTHRAVKMLQFRAIARLRLTLDVHPGAADPNPQEKPR